MQGRPYSTGDAVKDLHADLVRKWKRHGPTVEAYWTSFGKRQRSKCLKEGGDVLRSLTGRSFGAACKFIPEWNLRDLTEPGSDRLIDMIRSRASRTLIEQYCSSDDAPGDYFVIDEMMCTQGLRLEESHGRYCWMYFVDMDKYGATMRFLDPWVELEPEVERAIRLKCIIPQDTGELVLARQMCMLQAMNIVIEDILEEGSKSRGSRGSSGRTSASAITPGPSTSSSRLT